MGKKTIAEEDENYMYSWGLIFVPCSETAHNLMFPNDFFQ